MKLKLIHKLLIAMFACAALVLVLITLVTRASIGRGFVDFLQQQERTQVERVVPGLADWYRQHGSWDDLARRPRDFYSLVLNALLQESDARLEFGPGRTNPPPRGGGRGPGFQGERGGPGPLGRNGLPRRIFLLDAGHKPVVGEIPPELSKDKLLAVKVEGANVGWLGFAMIKGIELPAEEAFITQLRNNLLIGLALGLAVAALLAWWLARHLSRPVNEVAEGIRALAAGDYDTQLATRGSDEISRLGDDVNRLSSVLSEHETARKRWMSDMAHELRTPLAIITGELEAMNDGVRELNRENLDSVRDEVNYLSALVDDLHSLMLTDSGALAYKMQTVDLDELVQMTTDSFKAQLSSKHLELNYSGPAKSISLQGDEQRLRQLLRNLLDNAVRYTDSGGKISIMLNKDKQFAQLSISDSAPGASVDECERLFERLYRLEGSRNRNSGGSGLGLAICRSIVEAHGGQITAQPGPDGGLLITTSLPLT
ncbi:MAG: ATP-binding protein [Lysobacterales bacterium]